VNFPRKFYFLHILASELTARSCFSPTTTKCYEKYQRYGLWSMPTSPGDIKSRGIVLKDSLKSPEAHERCGAFDIDFYVYRRIDWETGRVGVGNPRSAIQMLRVARIMWQCDSRLQISASCTRLSYRR
jgi:hypothetical protein